MIRNKKNFEELEVLWKFSLPAILAGLMVGPTTWYCNYLLVTSKNGYEHMATFDIANQWRNTILFIPAALAQIALPLMSFKILLLDWCDVFCNMTVERIAHIFSVRYIFNDTIFLAELFDL